MIDGTVHRCAPLFEVGDLSTEKSDASVGGGQVRGQTGEPRFAGLLPCRDYMGHKYKFRSLAGAEGSGPESFRDQLTLQISS